MTETVGETSTSPGVTDQSALDFCHCQPDSSLRGISSFFMRVVDVELLVGNKQNHDVVILRRTVGHGQSLGEPDKAAGGRTIRRV
jgi:hypothetical protein